MALRDALSGTTPDNQGAVIQACADVLRAVAARVPAAPGRLVLTHPAGWGAAQFAVLRQAAAQAALPDPQFLAAPVAAARRVGADRAPGDTVAVLDFGHRGVDMLVVRRTAADFVAVGTPGTVHVPGAEPPETIARRVVLELLATVANAGVEPAQLAAVHVIGEGTVPATLPDAVRTALGVETRQASDPATAAVLGAAAPWPPVATARRRRSMVVPLVTVGVVAVLLAAAAGVRLANRPSRDTATPARSPSSATARSSTSGFAYVLTRPDGGDLPGSVTPIDPVTNTAGKPVTVGSKPTAIVITPDGKRAYVANPTAGNVTPIDLATGTTAKPIKVGIWPAGFGITPDGRTLYVSNSRASSVTPIDTATNTAGPPIPVGGITLSPDGRTSYALTSSSGSITPIDMATRTPHPAIKLTEGVQWRVLDLTPDGRTLYVADTARGRVTPIDTATGTPGQPISFVGVATAIAITPDSAKAYVIKHGSNTVTPFNVATGRTLAPIPVGFDARFMAMTADGETLYVAGVGRDTTVLLSVIDVGTDKAAAPITLPGLPIALVVSPTGGPAPRPTTAPPTTAPAPTGAAAAGQGGPGTKCGPADPFDGKATELVITAGTVSCQVVQEVLARYNSPSTPKEGSAALAEFDGWQCGQGSIAQIDATGRVMGCQRTDGSAAFVARIATP